jgi:hypothetical protein
MFKGNNISTAFTNQDQQNEIMRRQWTASYSVNFTPGERKKSYNTLDRNLGRMGTKVNLGVHECNPLEKNPCHCP